MRFHVAASLLAILIGMSANAHAGDVLLPPSNTKPSLGLVPKATQQPAATDTKDDTKTDSTQQAAPAASNDTAPVNNAPTAAAPQMTPTPAMSNMSEDQARALLLKKYGLDQVPPADTPMIAYYRKMVIDAQQAAAPKIPTQVMDEPPDVELPADYLAAQPNKMVAQLDRSYFWGPKDSAAVSQQLGYGAQQIPGLCQIRIDGSFSTPTGGGFFRLLAGQSRSTAYSGAIQSINFLVKAVCEAPRNPLPPTGNLIMRSGGKLIVNLPSPVNCNIPTGRPIGAIIIKYLGDGGANCQVQ